MNNDLSAQRFSAVSARKQVETQFKETSENITNSFKRFDAAMNKAMTGPIPTENLLKCAEAVNNIYTEGNLVNYYEGRAQAAVAGFNSMAQAAGGSPESASIDLSHPSVSHDGTADTDKFEIREEFAHEAINELTNLTHVVEDIANMNIGVNIEGAEDIDANMITNAKKNHQVLSGTLANMANLMLENFTNLSEEDHKNLKAIANSLLQ